jgi:hypothetical protein
MEEENMSCRPHLMEKGTMMMMIFYYLISKNMHDFMVLVTFYIKVARVPNQLKKIDI